MRRTRSTFSSPKRKMAGLSSTAIPAVRAAVGQVRVAFLDDHAALDARGKIPHRPERQRMGHAQLQHAASGSASRTCM